MLAAIGPTNAAEPRVRATLTSELTLTDNAELSDDNKEADLILRLAPSLSASARGARLAWDVNYQPSLLFYANNRDLSDVQNSLNASALLEAVDNFFFIEGRASVQQTFENPFLPTPSDSTIATDNRLETVSLSVSPYIQGRLFGDYRYLLRNDTEYTDGGSGSFGNTLTSRVLGSIDSPTTRRHFWGADYDYNVTSFEDSNSFYSQLVRARGGFIVTPAFTLTASAGYEWNDYSLNDYSGAIYGAGLDWRPTPRTQLAANWEERFFGPSYRVDFRHRTRLTSWTLSGSRNTETANDLLFRLAPGDTRSNLDSILTGRFPDPLQRELAIDQFMGQTGLPELLGSSLAYYNQNIFLNERLEAGMGILGVRNSFNVRLYWQESQQITASGDDVASTLFASNNHFRTQGGGVAYTHTLTSRTTLGVTFDRGFTKSLTDELAAIVGDETTQDTLRLSATHRLSPKTSVTGRIRFVRFNADVTNDYTENAVQALISHIF